MGWGQDTAINTLWSSGDANDSDPATASSGSVVPTTGSSAAIEGAVAVNTANGKMWIRMGSTWQLITGTGGAAGSMSQWYLHDHTGTSVTIDNNKYVKFLNGGGVDIDFSDVDGGSSSAPFDLTFTADVQLNNVARLTNKTFTAPQIDDASSNHQYTIVGSELSADRNATLPALTGNDVFVFEGHAQTLTNKTLTSPVINTLGWSNANHNHSTDPRGGFIIQASMPTVVDTGSSGFIAVYTNNTAIIEDNPSIKVPVTGTDTATSRIEVNNHMHMHSYELSFAPANSSNWVKIKAPSNVVSGGWTLQLPENDGTTNQVLQTNGSGVTSWATISGSGTVNSGSGGFVAYYATTGTTVDDAYRINVGSSPITMYDHLKMGTYGVRWHETAGANTNYVALRGPSSISSDITLLLPSTIGTYSSGVGQVLALINNSGQLGWHDAIGVVSSGTANSIAYYGGSGRIVSPNAGIMIDGVSKVDMNYAVLLNNVDLRFKERSSGNEYVNVQAPTSLSSNYTITWPTTGASSTQNILIADSSGNLSWTHLASATDDYVTGYDHTSGSTTKLKSYNQIKFVTADLMQFGAAIEFTSNSDYIGFKDLGVDYIKVRAPQSVDSGGWNFYLPPNDGNADQFLKTNGSGVTTWSGLGISGTVDSGSAGFVAYYASSTDTVEDTYKIKVGTNSGDPIEFQQTLDMSSYGIRLQETGAGSNYVELRAPAAISSNFTLYLPIDDGTANQILQTDGSGNLSWTTSQGSVSYGTAGYVAYYPSSGSTVDDISTIRLNTSGEVNIHANLDLNDNNLLRIDEARFEEDSGTDYIAVKAPASLSGNFTLTLPTTNGNPNQVLSTDGNGVLSWATPSTGVINSGTTGYVAIYSGSTAVDDHYSMYFTSGSSPSSYEINFYSVTADFNHNTNTRVVLPVGANKWAT